MCCAAEEDWVLAVGGIAQAALHHPVDHRDQQGGRWSCKALEGFDLRAPANLCCSNLKPEHLVHSSSLTIFTSNFCFPLLLCPPTVYILLSAASLNNWSLNERHLAEFTSFPLTSHLLFSFTFSPPSSSSSLNLFLLPGASFSKISACLVFFPSLWSLSLSFFAGQSDSDETLPAVF